MKNTNLKLHKKSDEVTYTCPYCGDEERIELYEFCESHAIDYDSFEPEDHFDLEVEYYVCEGWFVLKNVGEVENDQS